MNLPVVKLRLSEEFVQFADSLKGPHISLAKIVELVELRGHSLLLVVLSFPFMLPIPLPGLSVIFGSIIVLAGFRIGLGLAPWIPKSWLKREIKTETAKQLFMAASRILGRLERLLKPRLLIIFAQPWTRLFDGAILMVMGAILALPLPPGTNFPPALSILCMGLGMLEKDGLFILLSYFFFSLNILVFGAILVFGYEGALRLIQ